MTTFEIEQEFIKKFYNTSKELDISEDFILKRIAKLQVIFKQIRKYFSYFSKNASNRFSKKIYGNIEYGSIVFDNCEIEIEIDLKLPKLIIFFQSVDESDDYQLFSIDDICKFELKDNTLILL